MPTALERAIDQLSDPGVQLQDALRSLLVVGRRIAATELCKWIRQELAGYESAVPQYRHIDGLDVTILLDGPGGSTQTIRVPLVTLPKGLELPVQYGDVTSSIAELQSLAGEDSAAYKHVPDYWLQRYRERAARNEVPSYYLMVINRARVEIPKANLLAVLDGIRTAALELALDLEDVSSEVGLPGGLDVNNSAELKQVVNASVVNMFHGGGQFNVGEGTNLAIGTGATAVRVEPGDVEGLLSAAAAYLQPDGVEALREALAEDGDKPGAKTRGVLDKIKVGTYGLVGNMLASGAYDGILALIEMTFSSG